MRVYFVLLVVTRCLFFFFFNDTAPPEIYTLSLHDALPISLSGCSCPCGRSLSRGPCPAGGPLSGCSCPCGRSQGQDRKSTRLNSSHLVISYAVFCLKKKKQRITTSPECDSHSAFRSTGSPR